MCKKTCDTSKKLEVAEHQIGQMCLQIQNQDTVLAACQRDLADRDATLSVRALEITRLTAAIEKGAQSAEHLHRQLDEQVKVSQALRKQDEWQLGRIAELEGSNKDRWNKIQDLERQLSIAGTVNASDCIELSARRDECAKLQAELDQMTSWRDGAARECDKLGVKLDNMTTNYAHYRDMAEKQERTIIGLNNEVETLRHNLTAMTTSRREAAAECEHWQGLAQNAQQRLHEKRDQCDQEALARQRVQISLDKATARITELERAVAAPGCRPVALFHAEQRLSEKEGECRALRDQVAHQEIKIVNLRGELVEVTATADRLRDQITVLTGERDQSSTSAQHWWTMHQEALVDLDSLRQQLAQLNESQAMAPTLEVAACPCDDLQEALANLHKAGSAHLKYQLNLNTALVTFIQAHTRAGDLLEEINSL